MAPAIAEYADSYEPTIRSLVDTNATFNLTIDDVEVDAYWSYWLDGAGHNAVCGLKAQLTMGGRRRNDD
jgi:hypothetical protein